MTGLLHFPQITWHWCWPIHKESAGSGSWLEHAFHPEDDNEEHEEQGKAERPAKSSLEPAVSGASCVHFLPGSSTHLVVALVKLLYSYSTSQFHNLQNDDTFMFGLLLRIKRKNFKYTFNQHY